MILSQVRARRRRSPRKPSAGRAAAAKSSLGLWPNSPAAKNLKRVRSAAGLLAHKPPYGPLSLNLLLAKQTFTPSLCLFRYKVKFSKTFGGGWFVSLRSRERAEGPAAPECGPLTLFLCPFITSALSIPRPPGFCQSEQTFPGPRVASTPRAGHPALRLASLRSAGSSGRAPRGFPCALCAGVSAAPGGVGGPRLFHPRGRRASSQPHPSDSRAAGL